MAKGLRLTFTVLLTLVISLSAVAQERKYDKAFKYYQQGDLERVVETLAKTKVEKKDPYYRKYIALKGHAYYELRDFDKAREIYQKGYDELGVRRLHESAILRLLDIKYSSGEFDECLAMLAEVKKAKGAVYNKKPYKLIEDMIYFTQEFSEEKEYVVGYDSIINIEEWKGLDLGENVISFGGAFYHDSLVFSAYTEYEERSEWEMAANEGAVSDDEFEVTNLDLYIVPLDDQSKKVIFSEQLSTMKNEGALCFNNDFTEMYFTRHYDINGKDNFKIHYALPNKNGMWVDQGPLSFCNDKYSYMQPQLSYDGKTLYFSSNKPGGKGKSDIYYAKGAAKKWSNPVNMGAGINTINDDVFPYMRNDSIMIFASNGHVGFGGFDLFWVNITKKPYKVNNMLSPINTKYNEYCMIGHNQRADRVLFFSERGREDGEAMASILPDMSVNVTPVPFIMDMVALPKPTPDTSFIFDPSSVAPDANIASVEGGEQTGAMANGEQVAEVALAETSLIPTDEKVEVEIPDVIVEELKHLQFHFDSYELKTPAKETLTELPKYLNANPDVRLVISGHTDQFGKEDYNMMLSTERARETFRYLTQELDLDEDHFVVEANGEYFPIVETMDKEEAEVNRRVEFHMFKQQPEQGIVIRYKPTDHMPELINNLEALYLQHGNNFGADVREIKVKDIYRAKSDVNIADVAAQYGVPADKIKEVNNLSSDIILKAQFLMIPL